MVEVNLILHHWLEVEILVVNYFGILLMLVEFGLLKMCSVVCSTVLVHN